MGIDLGSSEIKCGIGVEGNGYYDIIAAQSVPSVGIVEGRIEQVDALQETLQEVIARTVSAAGYDTPPPVSFCLSSQHYYISTTEEEIRFRHGRVTHEDVLTLIKQAHREPRLNEYQLTQLVPQSFWIDGEKGSLSPWGQPAARLMVQGCLFFAHQPQLELILQLADSLGLEVIDIFCDLLVQAEGSLLRSELEGQVALLDIGSGSLKMMFFEEGRPKHFLVQREGSHRINQELQKKIGIEAQEAEWLKRTVGQLQDVGDEQKRVRLQGGGPSRAVRTEHLNRIISRVVTEMLSALRVRLDEEGLGDLLSGGIVLTGGGALLPGLIPLAESILRAPVRLGTPVNTGTCSLVKLSPYSALNGLILATLFGRSDNWFSSWQNPPRKIKDPLRQQAKKGRDQALLRRLFKGWD